MRELDTIVVRIAGQSKEGIVTLREHQGMAALVSSDEEHARSQALTTNERRGLPSVGSILCLLALRSKKASAALRFALFFEDFAFVLFGKCVQEGSVIHGDSITGVLVAPVCASAKAPTSQEVPPIGGSIVEQHVNSSRGPNGAMNPLGIWDNIHK